MANRVIFTDFFRVSFPHLDQPHAASATDTPKYSVSMMFPKTGVCPLNNAPSSYNSIMVALDEVCAEAWKNPTTGMGLTFAEATAPGMGIQFPPSFKDGDQVFEKDAAGRPIPGQVSPHSAGMMILSVKNIDPVGVVGADGGDIHPTAVYAGCWARAQVEVSAYDGKQGRVVVVKLLNVQMCYDDTKIGGKPQVQAASQAFAGMAIQDTNIAAGYGQGGAMPAVQPAAAAPAPVQAHAQPAAAAPVAPGVTPAAPGAVPAPAAQPVAPAAAAPVAPVAQPAAAAPVATPVAAEPTPVPAPAAPAAPAPAPAQAVVMNPGEAPYESYIAAGWTDELLIQHGKAQANFLNPAA